MGGLYGNAASTALEDCPPEARGIISGMLQQGYAFGYLLATAFARGLVNTTPHGWRPLFWFGACPPVLIIIFRLCLPETQAYQERARLRAESGNLAGTFAKEGKVALKNHWKLLIYMVLLMAGFNFMSHGSQDLYPTMLSNRKSYMHPRNTPEIQLTKYRIQILTKCRYSHSGCGKPRRHDWRYSCRLLVAEFRTSLQYYRHEYRGWCPTLPVHIHFQQGCYCRRIL